MFLHLAHKAREPIRHMFNVLSVYSSWQSSKAFKGETPASQLPVVDLITRRIPQLDLAFRNLCSTVGEWTVPIQEALEKMSCWCQNDPHLTPSSMQALALRMVLRNYTAFQRRIARPFGRLGRVASGYILFQSFSPNVSSGSGLMSGSGSKVLRCQSSNVPMRSFQGG